MTDDGQAGNLTVEFDHDGDGVPEGLAFTESDGSFRYQPAALAYGVSTIRARALQWDYVTSEYVVGDWSELTFAYLSAPNAPAIITSAYVDDGSQVEEPETSDGESGTSVTSTPTIVGEINNEWWLDDVWIEFNLKDENDPSDFSLMAVSQTDARGAFTFTPSGLPFGTSIIRLRSKEFDNESLSFIYGSWSELEFHNPGPSNSTVTIDPAIATVTASITGFSLAGGGSSATNDATLTGNVNAAGIALAGVVVNVSGGTSSGQVVTDTSGSFTFTLADVPEGYTTATASVGDGLGTLADGTLIIPPTSSAVYNFVFASDPSETAVQELIADLAATSARWQTAGNADDDASGTDEENQARDDAQKSYEDTLSLATEIRNNAVVDATQAYGSSVRIADEDHVAAITAAHDALLDELATFAGDTRTYPTPEFSMPAAPPDDALHIPDDRNQPRPPTAPTYGGPAYNFAGDQVYQSTVRAAKSARDQATGNANSSYWNAELTAKNTYHEAVQAASMRRGSAVSRAQSERNAAILSPHPTIDMAVEDANYARVRADALQRYNDMVARNKEAFETDRDEAQAELNRLLGLIDAADAIRNEAANADGVPEETRQAALAAAALYDGQHRADVQRDFQTKVEKLEHRRDKLNADALLIYETSLSPIELEYTGTRNRNDHFIEERKIIAEQRLAQATAQADKGFARDVAAAKHTLAVALATAEHARTIAITSANAESWKKEAAAEKQALERWADAHNGSWEQYQMELATHELTYVERMADKRVEYSTAVADATLQEARTIASAERKHANKEAQALYDRIKAQSAAERNKALDENDNGFDTEGRDIIAASKAKVLQGTKDEMAYLVAEYDKGVADANLEHDLSVVDATHALSYAAAAAGSAFIANSDQGSYAIDAMSINAHYEYSVAVENARHDLEERKMVLEWVRFIDQYDLQFELESDQIDIAMAFAQQNADGVEGFEIAIGEASMEYIVDLATSAAQRDSAIAGATRVWWDSSSTADETYIAAEVSLAGDRVVDDAESLAQFQETSAMRYAVRVAAWGDGTTDIPFDCPGDYACEWFADPGEPVRPSDPWRAYQLDLATAEYYRVVDTGAANVAYVTTVAAAEVTHTQTVAASDSEFASKQAEAYEKQITDMEQPLIDQATSTGEATVDHATALGAGITAHDREVVQINRDHEITQLELDQEGALENDRVRWVSHNWENDETNNLSGILHEANRDRGLEYSSAWWDLQGGIINDFEYGIRIIVADSDYSTMVYAANLDYLIELEILRERENEDRASANYEFAVESAGALVTNVTEVGGEDVALANKVFAADEALATAIQSAADALADARAAAIKSAVDDVATARETLRKDIALADKDLANEVAGADAELAEKLDDAGSTFREDSVAARGIYEVAMFDAHEQNMGAALASPLAVGQTALLLEHRFEVAEADSVHSTNITADLNVYHDDLTAAYAELLTTMNGADTEYVDTVEGAGYTHASNLATAAKTRSISLTNAEADRDLAAEKADSALARGTVVAEAAYTASLAFTDSTVNSAMAWLNEAWVTAAAAAEKAWSISIDDPIRDKTREHDYAVAAADAQVAFANMQVFHADQVGLAQSSRADTLAGIGKTHAETLAAAGTAYVSATSDADLAYINSSASSDNALVATVTGADTTYANASEGANRTLTGSLGTANVQLVQQTGESMVTQSNTIASSESEFHQDTSHHSVALWEGLTGSTPAEQIPFETEYRYALATSDFGWRQNVASAFTNFVTNSTQSDVDLTSDVADASRVHANANGDADVAFVASSAPLSATLQTETAATVNDYTVGTVTRDNARMMSLADTLGTLTKDEADAERTWAVDVAAAEQAWQGAKAQAAYEFTVAQADADKVLAAAVLVAETDLEFGGDYEDYESAMAAAGATHTDASLTASSARSSSEQAAELIYKQAVGDANLALATAESASRQAWINATLDAEEQFVVDESNAIKQRRYDIADHQLTYATSLAPVIGDRDVDYAEALTDLWDGEQVANNSWLASVTGTQAGFWSADYAHMNHLGLGIPNSWAAATNALGGAAYSAWQAIQGDYTNLADNINNTNTAYQDTLTTEYRSLATSLRPVDITFANALANADHTHATTFADLEAQFFIDMVDLSNTYLNDDEAAAHSFRVAKATAERHLFVGADYSGADFGPVELGEAVSTASNAMWETREQAERIYDRGDVTTFGAFNIALAENTHGYFATTTAANLTHSTAESALERAYAVAEANANQLRESTVASLDESYRRLESATLSAQLAGFAGSPWMLLYKDVVDADDAFRDTESTAAQLLRNAVAEADMQLEIDAANALEALTNRLAEIGADEVMQAANNELDQAIAAAVKDTVDFHEDITNPDNPEMPALPNVYSHAFDAVIEEDYALDEFYIDEGSMYWGGFGDDYVHELRFFDILPTDRSKLPDSFLKVHSVSANLERGIAERREFELPYELATEDDQYEIKTLSTFDAVGRLGDYQSEFVAASVEVPAGGTIGLGDGVTFAFKDTGTGADHAFGSSTAPKPTEYSDESGDGTGGDGSETDSSYGGESPGLPNANDTSPSGGSHGVPSAADEGPVYGPQLPPDHKLPRPVSTTLPLDALAKVPVRIVSIDGEEYTLVGNPTQDEIDAYVEWVRHYKEENNRRRQQQEENYARELSRIQASIWESLVGTTLDLDAVSRAVGYRVKHGFGFTDEITDYELFPFLRNLGIPVEQIVTLTSEEKEELRELINTSGDLVDKELLKLYLLRFHYRHLNDDGQANFYEGKAFDLLNSRLGGAARDLSFDDVLRERLANRMATSRDGLVNVIVGGTEIVIGVIFFVPTGGASTLLIVHGGDRAIAGTRTALAGERVNSYHVELFKAGYVRAGYTPEDAESLAVITDEVYAFVLDIGVATFRPRYFNAPNSVAARQSAGLGAPRVASNDILATPNRLQNKLAAWRRYDGDLSLAQWSKRFDQLQINAARGRWREQITRRLGLGEPGGRFWTPVGGRIPDAVDGVILREIKDGYVMFRPFTRKQIGKDFYLQRRGYLPEWHFYGGAPSKRVLDQLQTFGIPYVIH